MKTMIMKKRDPIWKVLSLVMVLILACSLFIVSAQLNEIAPRLARVLTIGMIGQAYAVEPDYIVDGVADDVQVQAALDALPAAGGKLKMLGATYNFTATIARAIGEVTIEGVGPATLINNDGGTALFNDGGEDNWLIQNIATDAGGVTLTGADSQGQNIWIAGTFNTVWSSTTGTGTVVLPNDSIDDAELFTSTDDAGVSVSITDFLNGVVGAGSMPRWDGSDWVPAPGGNGTDIYWGVIDVSTGTDPFVVGANETLTFISDDLTITGYAGNDTIAFAYAANSIVLGADTTGAYVATVTDAGSATITVVGSGGEGATITLDAVNVNCVGCIQTGQVSNLDISADTNLAAQAPAILTDDTIQVGNATTTTLGVAMFDPASFAVSAGGNVSFIGAAGGNGTDFYWGIVDTPLGTDPFITGANETLSLMSPDLDITGTAGNDTVNFTYGVDSIKDVDVDWGNGTNQINSNDILFEFLAGATYQTLQQWLTVSGSSGIITGGTVTENGDGTVGIAAGTGLIRTVNSPTSPIVFFDFAGNASVPLADQSTNYIYIDYNGGSPKIQVTTSQATLFDVSRTTFVGVFRDGNITHVQYTGSQLADYAHRNNLRNFEVDGVIRTGGQIASDNGNLTIAITAGTMYAGIDRITTNALDTGLPANTIDFQWTDDSALTWTTVTTQTLNNTQYNDITSGLVALTANRYAVLWIYVSYDGDEYHGLYGRGDYTLIQAENADPPTVLPNVVDQYANLVAKIIIQKSDTTMIIFTPFGIPFTGNFAENHNDLGALQGGTGGQYFHLTSAEHVELVAWLATATLGAAGALTLPSGQNFSIGTDTWNTGDLINMAKAANADLGDITTAGGVWSVEDNSHNHTGNTVSGISIANTTLTVGSPLTLTGDLLEIGNATTAALGASSYNGNHFDVTLGNVSLDANMTYSAIEFIIDGATGNITTGIKGDLEVPWDGNITRVTMLGADTGSIAIDIWVDTYANFPPTDADSITAAAVPAIVASNKDQDSTLTGWTTALNEGDIIRYNVDSITNMTRVTISLRITKT